MNSKLRGLIIGLLLILLVTVAVSQQPTASNLPQKAASQDLQIDIAKKTVVFFDTRYIENAKISGWSGTGFFVQVPDSRIPGRGVTWLVTNKHMLHPPDRAFFDKVSVRVNRKNPSPDGTYVSEITLDVTDPAGYQLWLTDPDESVDLALTVANPSSDIDCDEIPQQIFANKETFKTQRINENDDVLFTGLYASYPGTKRNFPIVRHGKLALVTDERIPIDKHNPGKTEELLIAEVTSFGGNSGSPVFVRVGGIREGGPPMTGYSYYLLGVMQGFFTEGEDILFDITASLHGTASQNSGLAAVIPAEKIREILGSPRAKAITDGIIANGLLQDGKYPEAEELYKHALTQIESSEGLYHPDLINVLQGYAQLLKRVGRAQEASKTLTRAQFILSEANKNPATSSPVSITRSCLPADCEKALTSKAAKK